MRPTLTPNTLPVTGRVFSLTIPDSEGWTAVILGALALMEQERYWIERPSGLTVPQTTAAVINILWGVGHE